MIETDINGITLCCHRIAKNQQYDAEGLIDIFRQYGDHLYSKGDHNGAIEQYIKTIGKLEPSYVIRKFLDSQHIDNLTTYLQALHKNGQATEDHTTLLLNCYTKLNHTDKLKEFIMVSWICKIKYLLICVIYARCDIYI